jgi:uncharacterized protein (TIGR02145 family)
MSFTTKPEIPDSVSDIDGNVYHTITIGNQVWLKENLKTTHYSDGTGITFPGGSNSSWQSNTTGAYAWYNNDVNNKSNYGALYNWYAVNKRNLCPVGWHVPTDAEWSVLTEYLGGETTAGGKMKQPGTALWSSPNTSATNESGFSAPGAGGRNLDGSYFTLGFNAYYWSSSNYSTTDAWSRYLYYGNGFVYRYNYNKSLGFSVRCIMD